MNLNTFNVHLIMMVNSVRLEHNGSPSTVVDLEILADRGWFIYKMFEKEDVFTFLIVQVT